MTEFSSDKKDLSRHLISRVVDDDIKTSLYNEGEEEKGKIAYIPSSKSCNNDLIGSEDSYIMLSMSKNKDVNEQCCSLTQNIDFGNEKSVLPSMVSFSTEDSGNNLTLKTSEPNLQTGENNKSSSIISDDSSDTVDATTIPPFDPGPDAIDTSMNIKPLAESTSGGSYHFSISNEISTTSHPIITFDVDTALISLGLDEDQANFIIQNGLKFLEKPLILSKRLNISTDVASRALDILKHKVEPSIELTPQTFQKIEICLKENPDIDSYEDISLLTEVDEKLVIKYMELSPLNDKKKKFIQEKYDMGITVDEISNFLKLPKKKVEGHIAVSFITFLGDEGTRVFEIIKRYCGGMTVLTLRKKILSKDLKLRDQLHKLKKKDLDEFSIVDQYFTRFEESKTFFDFDLFLNLNDILTIKQNDNVEQLSNDLNKIESVIYEYLSQYFANPTEKAYYFEKQENKIGYIFKVFQYSAFSLGSYRTIVTHSYDEIIKSVESKSGDKCTADEILEELVPLMFYHLKCSLPFKEIAQLLANVSGIPLTTHDIFHIIFQLSEPVLRGLCIEHYSFSNPVPLYYPKRKPPESESSRKVEFEICKELWYCLEQYNGLISFGLGRASWNCVGKSSLLDLIFETDFVKGSPQSSAFHLGSIDIQLTRNLFGETNKSNPESTKWAYIDCHSYSDLSVIQAMCSHLDVALIHVCYSDYVHNRDELNKELSLFKIKYLFIIIRDCNCVEINVEYERINEFSQTIVYIPELSRRDISYSVMKSLKNIGHDIIHLNINNRNWIQSKFIYDLMHMNSSQFQEIQKNSGLIETVTNCIPKSNTVDFTFLNYYPNFVKFMSLFYQQSQETDQKIIDNLNRECELLDQKLKKSTIGRIVINFNSILNEENSTLIVCKLLQELALSSNLLVDKIKSSSIAQQKLKNDKYTLEILWRETMLAHKYAQDKADIQNYNEIVSSNYSRYVGSGEAFELIDGDNLRFFNKEIDLLLCEYYAKQRALLEEINKGKTKHIKEAPIVISIIGPQSSGKSTLLNYCFGCKFLTSAGRCTRGIYGSLSKLDRPVNLSQSFLILDTEGLDAIGRENIKDTSMIHFDRTMVLFCLAVSQVVIINVRGDLGNEVQNLLQICAYSLDRLKVSKVKAPEIFFVLNQQADPDPNKHLDTINLLMEKLNSESELLETEGVKISDLIQLSRENLFILPSAFNSQQMNDTSTNLFDSDVAKLSPTIGFAKKCTNLRLAIIKQLEEMSIEDRAPFQTLSEWIEMAGIIWDTIIQYQDIIRYRSIEELKCNNKLEKRVAELMDKHFFSNNKEFDALTDDICDEIKVIEIVCSFESILNEKMSKFDEVFDNYKALCFNEYSTFCQNDPLLRRTEHICKEYTSNLQKMIFAERKRYEDRIVVQIKSIMTEIKISEGMKNFQLIIKEKMVKYCNYNKDQIKSDFEKIWQDLFHTDEHEEEIRERDECYSSLYSLFRMEYSRMENKQVILNWFQDSNFNMDKSIESIKSHILIKFHDPSPDQMDYFIYALNSHHATIKEMVPYNGMTKYSYLCQKTLYETENIRPFKFSSTIRISPYAWLPQECESLLKLCSGYYNPPDITWRQNKHTQVNILKSFLRDPDDFGTTTWEKFVKDVSFDVLKYLTPECDVSPAIVKNIIYKLCSRIKLLNYEIGFIHASLSNCAERTLSTLVFAYAFKYHWQRKSRVRQESSKKKEDKKPELFEYFKQKVENHKMMLGEWNRDWMAKSDQNISRKYALDLIESIKRGLITSEQNNLMNHLEDQRKSLSYEYILSLAYDKILDELSKAPIEEVTDTENFVVRYICDRNTVLLDLFQIEWNNLEKYIYVEIFERMKSSFGSRISNLLEVLNDLLRDLESHYKDEQNGFESDNFFGVVEQRHDDYVNTKEIPFKAMSKYLQQYLDPAVTEEDFREYFQNVFEVDGIQIEMCKTYSLPCTKSKTLLDENTFRRLVNTEIFNFTELIFNIHTYISHYKSVFKEFDLKLANEEFQEIITNVKNEFERNVVGCPKQCPGCGKFCEREFHPDEGKCQIRTGHQIVSMGGKVWNADDNNSAIMFMCDDFKDYTKINLPSGTIKWSEFKVKFGSDWDWNSPTDEKYRERQKSNQKLMKDIWNKFGRGILDYHSKGSKENSISFVSYSTHEEINDVLLPTNFFICFVIDGTGSMNRDISRVRLSVGQLINHFITIGSSAYFKVVIYRDHCDAKLIESFPEGDKFTNEQNLIEDFLGGVKTSGGGDFPEAVLDGLGTAATQSDWKCIRGVKNKIIHIFDAPPHGDFPDFRAHRSYSNKKYCCCCNYGTICKFDWNKNVWSRMKRFNIEYHPILTAPSEVDLKYQKFVKVIKKKALEYRHWVTIDLVFSKYESKMRQELGNLFGNFQVVGKEVVNDAILEIFVDHK